MSRISSIALACFGVMSLVTLVQPSEGLASPLDQVRSNGISMQDRLRQSGGAPRWRDAFRQPKQDVPRNSGSGTGMLGQILGKTDKGKDAQAPDRARKYAQCMASADERYKAGVEQAKDRYSGAFEAGKKARALEDAGTRYRMDIKTCEAIRNA